MELCNSSLANLGKLIVKREFGKMSICRKFGKDKLIYVTKEDHEKPCSIQVPELDERFEEHGLVTPSGDLNWSCPCVGEYALDLQRIKSHQPNSPSLLPPTGNMSSGPCGFHFKEAFGCFHLSKADPKGNIN